MWPTVIWQDTQLVVYYLGENEEDVEVRETRGIDFEEFFLHLDRGGSIFVAVKPQSGEHERKYPTEDLHPSMGEALRNAKSS